MIPTETINKLAITFDSLNDFGAQITEEQWHLPSQLPGWTVKDNLSHIIGTERVLLGLPETDHKANDLANVKNPIGEMNEHHVDLRRSQTGAEVFSEFKDLSEKRITQLRSEDDAYFNNEAMTPTGPGTIADFLHIRVLDIWVHEQDMRRTVGMPGHRGGPAAEHTIDRLIRTIPIVVGKRAATPEGGTVVIEITGSVERIVATTITDGRGQMSNVAPTNALCTITMDSDVFLQLATGRATDKELDGQFTVVGDQELGTKVVSQFSMMI
jgi:uncharacterized protein (TIGR03083 family)